MSEDKKEIRSCFMCHRTEEQAGEMIQLPGGITVCRDCMQKSFDAMDNPEIRSMLNLQNLSNLRNFPDMGMFRLDNGLNQEEKKTQETRDKAEEEGITVYVKFIHDLSKNVSIMDWKLSSGMIDGDERKGSDNPAETDLWAYIYALEERIAALEAARQKVGEVRIVH